MLDKTVLELSRVDLPYLLEADGVRLRLAVLAQLERRIGVELLGQVAVTALREDGDLRVELHAALKVLLGRARLGYAHIASGNSVFLFCFVLFRFVLGVVIGQLTNKQKTNKPLNSSIGVKENLIGRIACVDLDALGLGLFAQPLDQVAQANDVVAVIVHGQALEDRNGQARLLEQVGEAVLLDRVVQWRLECEKRQYKLVSSAHKPKHAYHVAYEHTPFSFQSGMSSLRAVGSIHAPESV